MYHDDHPPCTPFPMPETPKFQPDAQLGLGQCQGIVQEKCPCSNHIYEQQAHARRLSPDEFRRIVRKSRQENWEKGPDSLLQTQYSQFCNAIMMATFTGGIQIAILSFMNDFHPPGESPPPVDNIWQRRYTIESFGMMIGFLAVGLSMGCAGVAAVNASLTCYFSVYPPVTPPAMEGHVLLCMLLLFGSFALSGVSSTLLSTKFDIPFTVAVAFLLSGAVLLAGYQLLLQVLAKRLPAPGRPWLLVSVIIAAGILTVDLLEPTSSSWYTMLVCGCTAGSYIVVLLFVGEKGIGRGKPPIEDEHVEGGEKSANGGQKQGWRKEVDIHPFSMPPWVHVAGGAGMTLMWGGSAAVKVTWGLWDDVTQVKPYVLAGLSGLECLLFGIMTAVRLCKQLQQTPANA